MELLSPKEARQIAPLMLAYLGDSVIELAVRKRLLAAGCYRMNEVHRNAVKYVRASTQAKAFHKLIESLPEEEKAIAKRGRNAKANHVRKNADMAEYKLATGYEALVGYLDLTGDEKLLTIALETLYDIVEKGE